MRRPLHLPARSRCCPVTDHGEIQCHESAEPQGRCGRVMLEIFFGRLLAVKTDDSEMSRPEIPQFLGNGKILVGFLLPDFRRVLCLRLPCHRLPCRSRLHLPPQSNTPIVLPRIPAGSERECRADIQTRAGPVGSARDARRNPHLSV